MEVAMDLSTIWDSYLVKLDTAQLRRLNPRKCAAVPTFIDRMGVLSSEAQGLRRILTSYDKLVDCPDNQKLYILWEKTGKPNLSLVIGILKIGTRQLYLYRNPNSQDDHFIQTSPVCILDFYVHFTRQRRGYGHMLFDFMLRSEGVPAGGVAIDKPSESLLSFMMKHYGLVDAIWQTTKYVIYPPFFKYIENPGLLPLSDQSEKIQLVDSFNSPTSPRRDSLDATPVSPILTQTASVMNESVNQDSGLRIPLAESTPMVTPVKAQQRPVPQQAFVPVHIGNVSVGNKGNLASQARPTSSSSQMAKQRKIASMSHQSWY